MIIAMLLIGLVMEATPAAPTGHEAVFTFRRATPAERRGPICETYKLDDEPLPRYERGPHFTGLDCASYQRKVAKVVHHTPQGMIWTCWLMDPCAHR